MDLSSIFNNLVSNLLWVMLVALISLLIGSKWHETFIVWYKKIKYYFIDPAVLWEGYFGYKFEESEIAREDLSKVIEKIYSSSKLPLLGFSRLSATSDRKILTYNGTNFILSIDTSTDNSIIVKIAQTETSYKRLKEHIKRKAIKCFFEDVVEATIKEFDYLGNVVPTYSISVYFRDLKDNFYLTHWAKKTVKETILGFNVNVSDPTNKALVEYSLNSLKLNVCKGSLPDFLNAMEKYVLKAI